jgi:hypothetical protein
VNPFHPVRPPGGPNPWESLKLRLEAFEPAYVWVEIYASRRSMLKAIRRDHLTHRCHPKTRAAFLSYKCWSSKTRRVLPEVGTVYFHKRELSVANVAHEMTHVAYKWLRRRGVNLNKTDSSTRCPEERLAIIVGNLVNQFYTRQAKRVFWIAGDKVRWEDLKKE